MSLARIPRREWRRADWHWQVKHRVRTLNELSLLWSGFRPSEEQLQVEQRYPFAITPYYLSLIGEANESDPLCRMVIPHAYELYNSPSLIRDPLAEAHNSPVPDLIHRYPDRAVLLINSICPTFCRHCTRKRLVGQPRHRKPSAQKLHLWLDYLRATPQIRDVILSGGDPLMMSDQYIANILSALREIPSIEIIRIGTRIPVVMPMRITDDLCKVLAQYHPLWIITHFNHPREITAQAAEACLRLIQAGCPINNQSVLLRQINDHPDIIEDLCRSLMRIRVRPYYLHQCDLTQGIEHLRTSIACGLEIMEALRGRLGGLAIPQYVVDLPYGHGKVPLTPNYIISTSPHRTILRNHLGQIIAYPEPTPI